MNSTARINVLSATLLAAATLTAADLPALREAFATHFPVGAALNRSLATGTGWATRKVEKTNERPAFVTTF
jgi:hypothetical protein